MSTNILVQPSFSELSITEPVLKALEEANYITPTPIQEKAIPLLLQGNDLIGQAQTGTGKTAAFAIPALSNIDLEQQTPQILVLAPTRELALQVADAFKTYAKFIPGFRVLSIYGGQDYRDQLHQLKRGVQVVVGTPGRIMDHIRRRTLRLDQLKYLVLDEADEMLRMGFVDDVEWILEQTPSTRQTVLFSATLPESIRRIAQKYLQNPKEIVIKSATEKVKTNISQNFWTVSERNKLNSLHRIIQGGEHDGMIVFVRTKNQTLELKEQLERRGYSAAALSGDVKQSLRERTINEFKKGRFDILIATDVAARGLDIDRISHVVNYDAPYDAETYIHRIGRTGRAGRKGKAILFVSPKERRFLQTVERTTKQKVEMLQMPSIESINRKRINSFKEQITRVLDSKEETPDALNLFNEVIEQYQKENNVSTLDIAAALAKMARGNKPLLIDPETDNIQAEQFGDNRPKFPRRNKFSFRRTNDFPKRKKFAKAN